MATPVEIAKNTIALQKKQRAIKNNISLYKFLLWVKTDKKIKELRKELYGTLKS